MIGLTIDIRRMRNYALSLNKNLWMWDLGTHSLFFFFARSFRKSVEGSVRTITNGPNVDRSRDSFSPSSVGRPGTRPKKGEVFMDGYKSSKKKKKGSKLEWKKKRMAAHDAELDAKP